MRYRTLDANGDYSFGQSQQNFLIDSPQAVAQAVSTRLKLYTAEWFLDSTEGTPWSEQILGENTQAGYDAVIRNRILGTQGLAQVDSYQSSRDPDSRKLTVLVEITTDYGPSISLNETL
jgi:hypothetical protein